MAPTPPRRHDRWAYAAAHQAVMDAQARHKTAMLTLQEALARLHTLDRRIEQLKAPIELDTQVAALHGTLTRLQGECGHVADDLLIAQGALYMPPE